MTMITPSYLGETIEYSSLHACRSTLEDPTEFTLAANFATSAALSVGLGFIAWAILALARSFSGGTVAAAG